MKKIIFNFKLSLISFMCFLISSNLYSQKLIGQGSEGGGGGDTANEARVEEIRKDLLTWIENGGAKSLKFNNLISYDDYVTRMKSILLPKKVTVIFVKNDKSKDPELKVSVDGQPKTCRSLYSSKPESFGQPKIICNIFRFNKFSDDIRYSNLDTEQYRLIHHEFAGLVGVEKNEGAISDYYFSSQVSANLEKTEIFRLAIKNTNNLRSHNCKISVDLDLLNSYKVEKLGEIIGSSGVVVNGYFVGVETMNTDFVFQVQELIDDESVGNVFSLKVSSAKQDQKTIWYGAGALPPKAMNGDIIDFLKQRNLDLSNKLADSKSIDEYNFLLGQVIPVHSSKKATLLYYLLSQIPHCQKLKLL